MNTEKYIGKRFGRWTVIEFAFRRKKNNYWKCRCDCGAEGIVRIYALLNGRSKSCGCLSKEVHSELMKKRNMENNPSYKHGDWKSRLFKIWDGIKYRCNYSSSKDYKRYGGRGIKVCNEWQNDFVTFRDWALSHGYKKELIIDRIDNDGDYCPKNCRWVTYKESSRNTRTSCNYFYDGEYYTIPELAEKYGIKITTLKNRIYSPNWTMEEALHTPINGRQKLRKR